MGYWFVYVTVPLRMSVYVKSDTSPIPHNQSCIKPQMPPKLAAPPSPLLRTVGAIALEVQAVINYSRWICRSAGGFPSSRLGAGNAAE